MKRSKKGNDFGKSFRPETMRKLCLSTKFPHQEIKQVRVKKVKDYWYKRWMLQGQ